MTFEATAVAAVAWEAFEPAIKRAMPALFPRPQTDSPQNKAGDLAAFLGGWVAADRISRG
jgi:hypothetical protein